MHSYVMKRTQISLTENDRRLLDKESARTGRSVSALIRRAVEITYGDERSEAEDVARMRRGFGSWQDRAVSSEEWVEADDPKTRGTI